MRLISASKLDAGRTAVSCVSTRENVASARLRNGQNIVEEL